MTANDDITTQHDLIDEVKPEETLDDADENQVDGGEINEDLDKIHKETFGDENDKDTVTEEINRDEKALEKDLTKKQQTKNK